MLLLLLLLKLHAIKAYKPLSSGIALTNGSEPYESDSKIHATSSVSIQVPYSNTKEAHACALAAHNKAFT